MAQPWANFSTDIRLMILDMVAKGHSTKSEPYARAAYASVCQEWQDFWEKETFQQLILDPERLLDLDRIVHNKNQRRIDSIEHLWLRIKLGEYGCDVCQSLEDNTTISKNNATSTNTLWNLFTIISKWKRSNYNQDCGLLLELGAYSPSDSKHVFRDFRLEEDYPYLVQEDIEKKYDAYKLKEDRDTELNDLFHGWTTGRRQGEPTFESKKRLMGTSPLEFNFGNITGDSQRFPKVEIVTGLLIRRQYYRSFSADTLSKLFRESLMSLIWFRHERWHDVDPHRQSKFEEGYSKLILTDLPGTLTNLYLFEDYNHSSPPS